MLDADNLHRQKYREERLMEATVQVRQRGTLTLPADLRAKYGI